MRTPSIVSSWPVEVMSIVGGISVGSPVEVVWPSPQPICPSGSFASAAPYMKSGAPPHRRADEHVLGDGFFHEAFWGDDVDPPGVDVCLVDDPLDAPEVVDVRVRVDHRHHVAWAAVLLVERPRGSRRFLADQGVDHDHAALALDHAHHRQVEAAELVDPGHDFEQTVADQQLPLAPQARVCAVGGGFVEEPVGVEIPHDASVGCGDLASGCVRDEPALGVVEVLRVVEREPGVVHPASLTSGYAVPGTGVTRRNLRPGR